MKEGNVQDFTAHDVTIKYKTFGLPLESAENIVIWAHGWGQTHHCFIPLITPFAQKAHHIALDFAGFGESDTPPEDWGIENYTAHIAAFLKDQDLPPVLWVGHSFGCRVGVKLAAHYPALVKSMCLISGAGLKRKRPLWQRTRLWLQIKIFKLCRNLLPNGALKNKIIAFFGSADYNNAGALRKVFVRVVNEYLEDEAKTITCPVTLVYGQNDTSTPPEFGERYHHLIPKSQLHLLDGQDHYSVLQHGRHPVIKIIGSWISAA